MVVARQQGVERVVGREQRAGRTREVVRDQHGIRAELEGGAHLHERRVQRFVEPDRQSTRLGGGQREGLDPTDRLRDAREHTVDRPDRCHVGSV